MELLRYIPGKGKMRLPRAPGVALAVQTHTVGYGMQLANLPRKPDRAIRKVIVEVDNVNDRD